MGVSPRKGKNGACFKKKTGGRNVVLQSSSTLINASTCTFLSSSNDRVSKRCYQLLNRRRPQPPAELAPPVTPVQQGPSPEVPVVPPELLPLLQTITSMALMCTPVTPSNTSSSTPVTPVRTPVTPKYNTPSPTQAELASSTRKTRSKTTFHHVDGDLGVHTVIPEKVFTDMIAQTACRAMHDDDFRGSDYSPVRQ